MARGVLALLTGLLLTAGLLTVTTAPASAGQVGVTIGIRGAGSVHVVEGTLEDGGARSCVMDDNQNHHVTVSCPRIRNSEAFEAWVWLRATPSPYPAGEWIHSGWDGCDRTRIVGAHWECAVHSGAFSSDERYPVALFRDTVAPTITSLAVEQVAGADRQFRMSFGTSAGAHTECQVFGVGSWTQCWNGYVLTVPEGTYAIKVRSTDPSGNTTHAERVVSSVDTVITNGPEPLTRDSTPSFDYRTVGGDAFSCSLDGQAYASCGSGGTTGELWLGEVNDGRHTLRVRASRGDWVDPVPAEWTWTIDTVAPTSTVTADVRGTSASFQLSTTESGSFQCKLDTPAGEGAWDWCQTPMRYTGLDQGEHRLSVRARDVAGNVQVTPASHRWTVDTVAPTTVLDATTSADRATFAFSAPGATSFECRLTSPSGTAPWSPCSSPVVYAGLAAGTHRFEVSATDAAGNVESVPAAHGWTATAPVVGPPAPDVATPGTQSPVGQTPTAQTPVVPPAVTVKATSVTTARWKVSTARKGKVAVVVSAPSAPIGAVVITDRGRTIARTTLTTAHQGRIVVRLPRLAKGKHVLVVRYGGSATTTASSSARRIVTLR